MTHIRRTAALISAIASDKYLELNGKGDPIPLSDFIASRPDLTSNQIDKITNMQLGQSYYDEPDYDWYVTVVRPPKETGIVDRSTDPNVVNYAMSYISKGKNIRQSVDMTVDKLSGHENYMIGSGTTVVDPIKLERSLTESLLDDVSKTQAKIPHWTLEDCVLSVVQTKQGLKYNKSLVKELLKKLK